MSWEVCENTSDTSILRHLYNMFPVVIIRLWSQIIDITRNAGVLAQKTSRRLTCQKIRIVHRFRDFSCYFDFQGES